MLFFDPEECLESCLERKYGATTSPLSVNATDKDVEENNMGISSIVPTIPVYWDPEIQSMF